ncbi:MAG TPA: helix-turn-helix domain-containing protein [Candidatus Dormibacteraeota bacterium]|nr:helix-turn-helix domain-containing protein [Candidatus Dormibacteraeota bacterium]
MNAPAITVKDVWRGVLPPGTELLGGGSGLERRVEWACALRTRPPAFDAVKGGELAFVPVRSIRLLDERLDLAQLMTSFAEKGGVAVAALGDVSQGSIAIADQRALPLLRLPDATAIGDVHQSCVRFILDQRSVLHERVQELQLAMMELAFAGAGPAAIVDRLAELTSLTGVWQDEHGEVRHVTAADGELFLDSQLAAATAALLRWSETVSVAAADPPVREFPLEDSEWARLVSPIAGRRGIAGFVSLVGPQQHLTHVASLGVSRAAAACAIELDRERAVSETHERLEGEVIETLLAGTYASEAAAADRARRAGLDLNAAVAVLALRPEASGGHGWEATATRAVRAALQHREVAAGLATHEGAVCVVLPAAEDEPALQRLARALREDVASATSHGATRAGIGRPRRGVDGVRASYREAEQALSLGRRLPGLGNVISFGQLGLHRLLLAMSTHAELRDFHDAVLGRLIDYDQHNHAELLQTLEAYFACNASPTDTAHRLGLHRNTVLYRLRRIEEVGQLQLDDPATRLNLHLCLRIQDVLETVSAPL